MYSHQSDLTYSISSISCLLLTINIKNSPHTKRIIFSFWSSSRTPFSLHWTLSGRRPWISSTLLWGEVWGVRYDIRCEVWGVSDVLVMTGAQPPLQPADRGLSLTTPGISPLSPESPPPPPPPASSQPVPHIKTENHDLIAEGWDRHYYPKCVLMCIAAQTSD